MADSKHVKLKTKVKMNFTVPNFNVTNFTVLFTVRIVTTFFVCNRIFLAAFGNSSCSHAENTFSTSHEIHHISIEYIN